MVILLLGTGHVDNMSDNLGMSFARDRFALLPLGATRRMTIRAQTLPRRTLHVDRAAVSLLVEYAMPIHYTHAVPKTTTPVGERISLAFRAKPAR